MQHTPNEIRPIPPQEVLEPMDELPLQVLELDNVLPLHLIRSLHPGDTLHVPSHVAPERVLEVIPYLNTGVTLRFDQNVEEHTLTMSAAALRQGHVLSLSPNTAIAMFRVAAANLGFAVILYIHVGTSKNAARAAALALVHGGVIELHRDIQKNTAVAVALSLADHAGLYLRPSMDHEIVLAAARSLRHLNTLYITAHFCREMALNIASTVSGQVALQFVGNGPFPLDLMNEIHQIRAPKMVDPHWYNVLTSGHLHHHIINYDRFYMPSPTLDKYTSTPVEEAKVQRHSFFRLPTIYEDTEFNMTLSLT